VLGKAKVISYKDLKEARAKRAAKDKATADKGKGKRGCKRKSPALEVGLLEAKADLLVLKDKATRISKAKLAKVKVL
jgi:hypothetical protein